MAECQLLLLSWLVRGLPTIAELHRSSYLTQVAAVLVMHSSTAATAHPAAGHCTAGNTARYERLANGTCRVKHARHSTWWAAAMPVIYSVASALVCTQGLIFNKAVMVLWRMTLAGDNQVGQLLAATC
jgi:hypothetical protein